MAGLFDVSGSFSNTFNFLKVLKRREMFKRLEGYAQIGVNALAGATPADTGITAASWSYEIIDEGGELRIIWSNSNVVDGWFNVAVGIQYGHGTGTGGYVTGIDYINPALKPVFDAISEKVWKAVTSA